MMHFIVCNIHVQQIGVSTVRKKVSSLLAEGEEKGVKTPRDWEIERERNARSEMEKRKKHFFVTLGVLVNLCCPITEVLLHSYFVHSKHVLDYL